MTRPVRVPGIPEQSVALFSALQQEDLLPLATLKAATEAYRQSIAQSARRGGPASTERADGIARALTRLLERVNHLTEEPAFRVLQAAVRYFLIQEDGGGHDLDTPDGLDDDARVVNAVVSYLGRPDLAIPIPEPAPAAPAAQPRRQFAMPPPRR